MLQLKFIFSVHGFFFPLLKICSKVCLTINFLPSGGRSLSKFQTLARAWVEQHTVSAFKALTV